MGTITACALLLKTALVEPLKFPFRMVKVLLRRGSDIFTCEQVHEGAIRVPTFYAPHSGIVLLVIPLTSIVAMLFGGIHCAAWNFPFPSHAELIIWRVCSLIIVVVPGTLVSMIVALALDMDTIFKINVVLSVFGIVIYVLARLTLLVEAFIALRHLPPGAYAVVKWTALLLHM